MLPVIARTVARTAARTATVTAAVLHALVAVVLLPASPASAVVRDDGTDSGDGLSVVETLLWFVGAPLVLFVAIVLLTNAPSMARGPRYRPGLGWWAAPVWFNGPAEPDRAVRNATATTGGGGASARW